MTVATIPVRAGLRRRVALPYVNAASARRGAFYAVAAALNQATNERTMQRLDAICRGVD